MTFDELMDLYRNDDNYITKNSNQNSNICYVFFSSHGLYKENNNIRVLKMYMIQIDMNGCLYLKIKKFRRTAKKQYL